MANIGDDITRRLFVEAGIKAGMRVLDLGCGPGNVSVLVAKLVGDEGTVVGVDRDAKMIEMARGKVRDLGLENVSFAELDLSSGVPFERDPFDAIVVRRVLMYLPDPADAIRRVIPVLKEGGLVAVQEHDMSLVPAYKESLPLHERVQGWFKQTLEREGANFQMGFDLDSVLTRAGLVVEQIRAEAILSTRNQPTNFAFLARVLLPRMLRHGVVTEEEVELETLDERLADERRAIDSTYISDMVFCAWARKIG